MTDEKEATNFLTQRKTSEFVVAEKTAGYETTKKSGS